MSLKLACADFAFPLLPHDNSLDLIAMLGFEGVDIGLFEGRSHLWPSRVFADLKSSAKDLKRKLRDRGLELADVFLQTAPEFVSIAPNHPDLLIRRQARDWFARTVEFALECGGRHISALPGVTFADEPEADSYERCRDELAWRCQAASSQGVTFSVEAHVGSIVPTPESAARLVQSVPGLTLSLDYTHFTRAGFPDHDVEPLIAHASHFHARGARLGRLQASLKENVIDYGRILDVMRSVGYAGFVGVEYVWIDWEHCNEVDNLSETILMRDYLREHGSIA
jgi:sugar phosphate isomerase/epimerase